MFYQEILDAWNAWWPRRPKKNEPSPEKESLVSLGQRVTTASLAFRAGWLAAHEHMCQKYELEHCSTHYRTLVDEEVNHPTRVADDARKNAEIQERFARSVQKAD